jgi:hypothetical protein
MTISTSEIKQWVMPTITDADHLALCAEKLMEALNECEAATQLLADCDTKTEEERAHEMLEDAELKRGEYWRDLQYALYEYRKRSSRLRSALT